MAVPKVTLDLAAKVVTCFSSIYSNLMQAMVVQQTGLTAFKTVVIDEMRPICGGAVKLSTAGIFLTIIGVMGLMYYSSKQGEPSSRRWLFCGLSGVGLSLAAFSTFSVSKLLKTQAFGAALEFNQHMQKSQ